MRAAAFTPRRPLDYYPTPANVTGALRDWLRDQHGAPHQFDRFLDPAAGDGMIVDAMRDVWGESFWHAIEINGEHSDALDDLCEDVAIADATVTEWPEAHVIANPPFALLDQFWSLAAAHRAKHAVWVAMLTPVAWWNAESRRSYTRPDYFLSLGWRPSFHRKDGPAHKGSQDFCWAVLAPVALPFCEWRRLEKPAAIAREAAARGVRAPGDPERRSREERHEAMGVAAAAGEWKGIRKDSVDVWAGRFCELLRSGPRTLNALTVEAADATADMAGPNAVAALWALKSAGVVEHTPCLRLHLRSARAARLDDLMQPIIKVPADGHGLNVVASVSGGKDSTALILALREADIAARYVFADTGWEAPETLEYLDYLRAHLSITIDVVGKHGGMVARVRHSAGFPGRMQRWCTRELKIEPLRAYHDALIEATGIETISAMGVRAEESESRSKMPEWEDEPEGPRSWGGWLWRPLLRWTVVDVLEIHNRHGVRVNPLYQRGHNRVGCYPCIFATKEEVRLIADHAPGRIDEIRQLEAEMSALRVERNASEPGRYKHEDAQFFQVAHARGLPVGIDAVVAWARTDRGGRQLPLLAPAPTGGCMRWGICDLPSGDAK